MREDTSLKSSETLISALPEMETICMYISSLNSTVTCTVYFVLLWYGCMPPIIRRLPKCGSKLFLILLLEGIPVGLDYQLRLLKIVINILPEGTNMLK